MDRSGHILTEPLPIRPERIDPAHLVGGRPPAVEAAALAPSEPGRGPRTYELAGMPWPVRIDLWDAGKPGADDGERLRDLAEDLLAPPAPTREKP